MAMANSKLIGALLGTLSLGGLVIPAHAGEDAPKSEKGKKGKKGGEKSCSGDKKGGEKSCSGEKGCNGKK